MIVGSVQERVGVSDEDGAMNVGYYDRKWRTRARMITTATRRKAENAIRQRRAHFTSTRRNSWINAVLSSSVFWVSHSTGACRVEKRIRAPTAQNSGNTRE